MEDELRRELPPEQAEYCIQRMNQYRGCDVPEVNKLNLNDENTGSETTGSDGPTGSTQPPDEPSIPEVPFSPYLIEILKLIKTEFESGKLEEEYYLYYSYDSD